VSQQAHCAVRLWHVEGLASVQAAIVELGDFSLVDEVVFEYAFAHVAGAVLVAADHLSKAMARPCSP
jgi:Zn finger protein HypA/HybF involved in hydrogenase expression